MVKVFLLFVFIFCNVAAGFCAPCYGTSMPQKKKFFAGIQMHSVFKRYLENEQGKIRSMQNFLLVSYGLFDWLSLDLKGGAGNLKQHPVGSDEVDYSSSFAGGYGFRIRLYEKKNTKCVFGFQHISVHPKKTYLGDTEHKGILDDWQVSLLGSYNLKLFAPYLGVKWSRDDYIHRVSGNRKRVMSDRTKSIGLAVGADIPLTKAIWVNLEGQFIDVEAAAVSLNFKF